MHRLPVPASLALRCIPRITQALAAFAAALAAAPAAPECVPSLLGCAAVYKDSGLLPEALSSLERAELALAPQQQQAAPEVGGGAAAAAAAAGLPSVDDVRQALAIVLTDLGGRVGGRVQEYCAGSVCWRAVLASCLMCSSCSVTCSGIFSCCICCCRLV